MLVSKSEVKQTSKKLLSVLLAVIMIMTSMSVCFGNIAFAAATGATSAQWSALESALNNDTVKNANFTGSNYNYIVDDPDGKIIDAVEAYWAVFSALADKDPSGSSAGNRTINQINASIKSEMASRGISADKFFKGMLAGADVTVVTATGSPQTSAETKDSSITAPGAEYDVPGAITVTVTMAGAVTGYTLDELPDSVVTSKSFTVTHKNDKYDYSYTTSIKKETSGCDTVNVTYYTHKHTYYTYIGDISSADGASVNTQTIKNTAATLAQYADYFSMNMDQLYAVDAATLDTVSSAVSTAKSNVVNGGFGLSVFNHFFSDYKVDTLVSDITYAKEIQVLAPKLLEAYEKMEEGYDAIITDKAELNKVAGTMLAAMDAYDAATATAKAYVTGKGFVRADVEAYRNAVLREIELIELRELIDNINAAMLGYSTYDVDDVDAGTVTSAMITAAISNMNSLTTQLSKYKDADIVAIGGADFKTNMNNLKSNLTTLSNIAGYNDDFASEYAKFASEIFSVTDANGDIDTLLSALQNYDSWYTGLKSLISEMKSVLGEEIADKLFDDLNDVMTSRMDDAYVALNATLEAQIDYAYDLFYAYTSAYGEKVNMASVSEYRNMKASIGLINADAYYFIEGTSNFDISDDAVTKYTAMQKDFPQYQEFLNSNGFATYQTNTIGDLERADTIKDIARENENGVYKTSDEDIEAIIDLLDALLQNDSVKELLGQVINKDEDGNPTGEPFELASLITGLLDDVVYTDSLINTIMQFVYPLVLKEFAKVWAGLPEDFTTTAEVMSGVNADVYAELDLYDVETAISGVGLHLSPATLAANLEKNAAYSGYTQVINKLKSVTAKADYQLNGDGDEDDTFSSPWEDTVLFKNVYDEETGEQIFNDDGTPKQVYDLDWGVDTAENKREAFVDAACAALSGLEPLLFALISNQSYTNPTTNAQPEKVRGSKIGTNGANSTATVYGISLPLTLDPITLMFQISANDGWDNALVPIFEALGLENIPHSEDLTTTRKLLENGLLAMVDQLISKVSKAPVTFILEALPNLCYALEGGLVEPLLNMLNIDIYYEADAYYSAHIYVDLWLIKIDENVADGMQGAMKAEQPININIGDMLNLKDMGLDISSFQAIWDMIAGGVELLADLEAPNAGYIATLGKLVEKDTNRSEKTYNHGTAGKAYHIEANKADVLIYLIKYVLGSGLLDSLVENPEGIVADIFASLNENPDTIIAAVVELLNQKEYDTLRNYEWFDGTIKGESVVGNSANEIYLNPENDWTEEKADFLYKNLDSIVSAVLTLAKLDLDKTTEEVDGSIGSVIGDAVGGILGDKTLTALATLLAKLDLNALLAGSEETEEETEGETETVAEGEEEATTAPALDIDVNALVKEFLGIDLAAVAADYADIAAALVADPEYVADFGVDAGTTTFSAALTEMLAPLTPVLDFILAGENLTVTVEGETVELIGYDGYNNAIIPILEALGCDVAVNPENTLKAVIDALVGKIDALTASETLIKDVIDILPGVFYFIASKGLSVSVRNLLQPVYVILDTIRPVYDLNLNELINTLLPEDFGIMLNIDDIGLDFVFDLLAKLVPDLDLSALKNVIYDICNDTATAYKSASTLIGENGKKGAFGDNFSAADFITVVLSFVLEWATIEDNAAKLDEMLGTDGLISKIDAVFADVDLTYGTPDWMYWFETEEEFNEYVDTKVLPNTLYALEYPNDWSKEAAAYIADNLASLADMVVGLIEIDGVKYPSVAELINAKLDVFNAETINSIIALITDLLAEVDDNLLSVGYLLDVDIVGLKNYTCTAEITDVKSFASEFANILTTYAGGLVNWLFFGDDFRFAKKSDKTDTIVINGGEGYEKALALVLEALGCELPAEVTVESILLALATRVEAILASPVNEVIDLLPNLIYFLNANGAGVAVDNLLQPVYALLDKLAVFGVELDLAELLGFDLKYLSLADILALVNDKTGLDLSAAEEMLVNLCLGEIKKGTYTYKMVAPRKDTITVILTTALLLVKDENFAAKLEELMGTELISAITAVFESAPVTYATPDWYALDENDIDYNNATVGVIKHAITYPNNWTEESATYLANNLEGIGNMVAGIIDSNYETLGALLSDKVNIYTADTLASIQTLLGDLIGGLDEDLKELVNVGLGAADSLLGADVQGLLDYDVSSVKDKASFLKDLTGMLMEIEGLIDWLLLGEDYKFFVDNAKNDIITINGGHGYAEGLALVLEALGVEDLPEIYVEGEIDTEEVIYGVLSKTFDRVDAIFASPVAEVFDIIPNVLYFINSNGLTVAVENLLGAVNALLLKLEGLGIELDIASLVNFSEILGVETELALDNITMEAVVALVAELTGLNLDKVADVLVGFALGRVALYDSVSSKDTFKMYYHDDFAKADMITALATVAIITLTDEVNAEKIKELLGEEVYAVILNLINMGEVPVQDFSWIFTTEETGGNRVGEVFSAADSSELFGENVYGMVYTEEMAQHIADNFGEFVNNIVYLTGLDTDGDGTSEADLKELINSLLGGSVYNSGIVISIRDALAGVLANLTELEVNGKVVGGLIADVLKTTGVADIAGVAKVKVPEFDNDRDKFVEALCDVLEPLYGILKFVLADEDISFFVNMEKTDAITLKGAEGYAYGIIPLLETLGCKDILTPAEYYAAVEADGAVLLTSILNPLFDRIDEILADDPAQAILDMLPNLIYFVNSNGIDTVVKNTLNAVYTLLSAIEPIAKIDLYELIGIDLAEIDFQWIVNKVLEALADAGYEFTVEDINYIAELTVGKLEQYTSLNGKTAYKMVYAEGESGDQKELVTVVANLGIRFIANQTNKEVMLRFLREQMGMTSDVEPYVDAFLDLVIRCVTETQLGAETALATIYYVFYGVDTGVDGVVTGKNELKDLWVDAFEDLKKENSAAGELIEEILGWEIFEDIFSAEEGFAPNGLIKFFTKIVEWFKAIVEWFKNLFAGFSA